MENGFEELELVAVALLEPVPLLELEAKAELKKNPFPGVGGASVVVGVVVVMI